MSSRDSQVLEAAKKRQASLTPEYYEKNMPANLAQSQADQLGIPKDQMFKLYSAIAQSADPMQVAGNEWQSRFAFAAPTPAPQYGGQSYGNAGAPQQAQEIQSPWIQGQAKQYLQQAKVAQAMGWGGPQQQQAPQFQMPQLGPAQPMPSVQTQALTPRAQFGGVSTPQAPFSYTPPLAASAQATTPLFNPMQQPQPQLGVQPLQPGQIQPQQFQQGGLVQNQQDPQKINIQQSDPNKFTGIYNPGWAGNYLGALALNMPMAVNPLPSGTPSSKSGVAPVGGAQYYDIGQGSFQLPSGDILTQDQMNSLDAASVNELQRGVGLGTVKYLTPAQAGPARSGPWFQTASIFNPAQMPTLPASAQSQLTPRTQPNAAQMPAPGPVPTYAPQTAAPMPAQFNFGNVAAPGPPPPAPTAAAAAPAAMPPFMAAHNSALEQAGKAIFAHYGGDPKSATPEQINAFHQELQSSLAGGPPIKRRSGGIVPGSGNADTVPAMLTPGEFVMNKDAVKNLGVGNLQAMNRQGFQQGGPVLPREAEHRVISPDASSSAPAAPDSGQSPTSWQPSSTQTPAPATASIGTSQGPAWGGYADRMSLLGTNAYQAPAGSGALTVGDVAGGAAIPGGGATQSLGQLGGPGSGQPTSSALSTIGAGLTAAAKTYADSVKPWQVQASHIPDPSQFRRYQTPTLSQQTLV